MMVLLVLYKSKCKSKADESLEAAITAVVAEEQELEAVLSQTKYDFSGCIHRQSLGNMSAPAFTRFSSVGGDYILTIDCINTLAQYLYISRNGKIGKVQCSYI